MCLGSMWKKLTAAGLHLEGRSSPRFPRQGSTPGTDVPGILFVQKHTYTLPAESRRGSLCGCLMLVQHLAVILGGWGVSGRGAAPRQAPRGPVSAAPRLLPTAPGAPSREQEGPRPGACVSPPPVSGAFLTRSAGVPGVGFPLRDEAQDSRQVRPALPGAGGRQAAGGRKGASSGGSFCEASYHRQAAAARHGKQEAPRALGAERMLRGGTIRGQRRRRRAAGEGRFSRGELSFPRSRGSPDGSSPQELPPFRSFNRRRISI